MSAEDQVANVILDAVTFCVDLERLLELSPHDAVDVLHHWEHREHMQQDPQGRAHLCRTVFARASTRCGYR